MYREGELRRILGPPKYTASEDDPSMSLPFEDVAWSWPAGAWRTIIATLISLLVAWVAAMLSPWAYGGPADFGTACAAPTIYLPITVALAGLVVGGWFGRGGLLITAPAALAAGILSELASALFGPGQTVEHLSDYVLAGVIAGAVTWLAFFSPPFLWARYGVGRAPWIVIVSALAVVAIEVVMWFVIVGLVVGLVLGC